jgi:hypothetical protein
MKHPYKTPEALYTAVAENPTHLIICHQCGAFTEKGRANFYIDECPLGGEYGHDIYERCDACEAAGCAETWRVSSDRLVMAPVAILALLGILGALESDPAGVALWVLLWIATPCWSVAHYCRMVARKFERKANLYVRK